MKRLFAFCLLILCASSIFCQQNMLMSKKPKPTRIDGIYYVLHDYTHKAIVSCHNPNAHNIGGSYKGDVFVPNIVSHKGVSYVVTEIGEWAFANCPKLTSVILPDSLEMIQRFAFSHTKQLKSIKIPQKVYNIGEGAFIWSGISEVKFQEGLKYISRSAFEGCSNLNTITIPESVVIVGSGAFCLCDKLKEIKYPQGLDLSKAEAPASTKLIAYNPRITTVPQPKPANTQDKKLAKITWLDGKLSNGQYTFKIGIKSESKIEKVDVYVNENLERGIVAIDNDGYDMVVNRTVDILEGQNNTIKIVVTNASGNAVEEKSITYKDKTVTPSGQPKRIALVMGNANYKVATKLKNPVNDATDVATKLENLGFTVIRSMDQTYKGMDLAIRDFGNQAQGYDVALFYYAGHGMQYDGINYIIPIDADLHEQMDAKYHCVNMNEVLEKMDGAKCPMKIVILDACRNNPFRSWTIRGADAGLCNMNAPTGTFIAFSTAPGRTAFDGTGRNSPYTAAILQILDVPGLSLTDFFQEVLEKVAKDTKEQQNPWTSGSFRGKFFFNKK